MKLVCRLTIQALCSLNQKNIKTHDGQTTRWHRMLYLDPGGEGVVCAKPSWGGGFATFRKSTEVSPADHIHLE